MPALTPWLEKLMREIISERPLYMNADRVNQLDKEHVALNKAMRASLVAGDDHGASARAMAASALRYATNDADYKNDYSGLLTIPRGDGNPLTRGALFYRSPEYYMGSLDHIPDQKLPMAYIEALGAPGKGSGTALVRELAKMYPDNPIGLHAIDDPATLSFYDKRGFITAPHEFSPSPNGTRPLPFMYLPRGADVKRKGGLVQMMRHRNRRQYEDDDQFCNGGLARVGARASSFNQSRRV